MRVPANVGFNASAPVGPNADRTASTAPAAPQTGTPAVGTAAWAAGASTWEEFASEKRQLPFHERLQDRLFGPDSRGFTENWLQRLGKQNTDVTARFQARYAAAKTGQSVLPADAKQYGYVLVEGLYGRAFPHYMAPLVRRLEARGLEALRAPFQSERPVADNAAKLRDFVLDYAQKHGGRQVVLVGYSKGGVDVAEAVARFPEIKPHIRAVVTLNSPYGGTPMATDVVESRLRHLYRFMFKHVFKGDYQGLVDITYAERIKSVLAHPYPADEIPTVCLASHFDGWASLTGWLSKYAQSRYGILSDGMIPMADAQIPGAKVVKLGNVDHQGPGMEKWLGAGNLEPDAAFETMLSLALDR